jgi:SAM-dependent methyltransferase
MAPPVALVRRLSRFPVWPRAFDPGAELDWSDPAFSRRLLAEHLDQAHDGASRRRTLIARHVSRLRQLLPDPPARILDAGCGPGLYAVGLAGLGYRVDGVDLGPAVIRHARKEARASGVARLTHFEVGDVRNLPREPQYDAILLIYYVLENLTAPRQAAALRRLAALLRPGGRLIAEFRLRPDQLPGRLSAWEVSDGSLLGKRRQLLLSDSVYDRARNIFILREVAIFPDGSVAVQQTTSRLLRFEEIPVAFARAGMQVTDSFDAWTRYPGSPLCDSVLVVAEPEPGRRVSTRRAGSRQPGSG